MEKVNFHKLNQKKLFAVSMEHGLEIHKRIIQSVAFIVAYQLKSKKAQIFIVNKKILMLILVIFFTITIHHQISFQREEIVLIVLNLHIHALFKDKVNNSLVRRFNKKLCKK